MKRPFCIWAFLLLASLAVAQDETGAIDSLESVVARQEKDEKVLTMMELSEAFFDFSFDDCVSWGEKAIQLAREIGDAVLEADAHYALGVNYGFHSDLDLAQVHLKNALELYRQSGREDAALEPLWSLAYFESLLGNKDSAYVAYQKVLAVAEQCHDQLACAQANANMAYILYQGNDFEGAIKAYELSRDVYASLGDSLAEAEACLNLAVVMGESGRAREARQAFVKVMPKLEVFQDKGLLLTAYKNYGMLFVRDFINYDSATYYYQKALACAELEGLSPADRQTVGNAKADLLVEMGNVAVGRNNGALAESYFKEAFALAEKNKYPFGQMQAAVSLGQLYAEQGKAALSLYYLDIYAKGVRQSGITMMELVAKKALIMDYARLGRFDEMGEELGEFEGQNLALQRENSDLYDQLDALQDETQWLCSKYETQDNEIELLQSQRNHYRLAFFGLLAMVLAVLVLAIAYEIVRKKREKV